MARSATGYTIPRHLVAHGVQCVNHGPSLGNPPTVINIFTDFATSVAVLHSSILDIYFFKVTIEYFEILNYAEIKRLEL